MTTPIHFVRGDGGGPLEQQPDIIDLLLQDPASQNCIVDLEVGRYDKDVEIVQLPLPHYLEWLHSGEEEGKMNGKQVYLAQWRAMEDVSSVPYKTVLWTVYADTSLANDARSHLSSDSWIPHPSCKICE